MRNLPRGIIVLLVLGVVYLAIWAFFEARSAGRRPLALDTRPPGPRTEKLDSKGIAKAPDISIVHNGAKVSLTDFKGKVVLLDFWATWCQPCRESIPMVQGLYSRYQAKGFRVIGPALERDGGDMVPRFAQAFGMTYPVGLPTSRDEVDIYGATSIPAMVLVDKKGIIRWSQSGFSSDTEALLDGYVQQLLAER